MRIRTEKKINRQINVGIFVSRSVGRSLLPSDEIKRSGGAALFYEEDESRNPRDYELYHPDNI